MPGAAVGRSSPQFADPYAGPYSTTPVPRSNGRQTESVAHAANTARTDDGLAARTQTTPPVAADRNGDGPLVVRAQAGNGAFDRYSAGSNDLTRGPMPVSGLVDPEVRAAQFAQPLPGGSAPPTAVIPPTDPSLGLGVDPGPPAVGTTVPWDVYVTEARTGQFMVGVGINSDAGVTGQVILDERNFDITRVPTSWDDFINGSAFRGAGQGFRVEAVPGSQVQRYMVSFTEPYLFDTQVSLNVSGFYYQRGFFDWREERLGGRIGAGYRLTPDLSFSTAIRMENVTISNPRVVGVPELDAAVGDSGLYSPRFTITHDTRDIPFSPTEGYYLELAYEQVFGSYDYPRGELDFRKYFLVNERPDGSGRHTLAYNFRLGFSGSQTPIFENYFAGGYSTLRGFNFRGASPKELGVAVGGEFRFLGSVEYFFPLTADDMVKGVVFCDFGTVEEQIAIHGDDYRVAPGFGLRISVPALGPAPIALDFAVPVAREDTDDIQNFSFFFGFGRS